MEKKKGVLHKLPGWMASILMIAFSTLWTFWGIAEMFHEGWWGAWYNRLPYLIPIAATLIPTLVSFKWPYVGGGLIVFVGIFALFTFHNAVGIVGIVFVLIGLSFIVDQYIHRRYGIRQTQEDLPWWRRRWRYVLAIGLPFIVAFSISARMLPIVLTRIDDGDRSTQLIDGNDVTLIWAPEGPGWNWQQPWGGYPSWQSIALYGVPPVGLDDKAGYGRSDDGSGKTVFATHDELTQYNICRFLNEKGTILSDERQDIWRMPTTDELVRSLVRHGENAGCVWQGEIRQRVNCAKLPDKESPLWAADQPVIYYWSGESFDEDEGYFVAYNGTVNADFKLGGNPRHGYRCVRDP